MDSLAYERHANFFFLKKHARPNFTLWSSIGTILAARCSESRFNREIHTSGNGRCEIKEVEGVSLPHK